MVDVSSQNSSVSINVSSSGNSASIKATSDTALYYSEKSREWAISNRIVDGVDYSSKYYAQQSGANAQKVVESENKVKEIYNALLEESSGVSDEIREAGNEALTNIETVKNEAVDSINSSKTTIINDIEFVADGEKKEIEDLIDNGKEEIKESIGDVKVLTTLEIGDIGFTQMAIDESKGKRRLLNGSVIIQEQYVQFTNIIKNSVALNPSLACTEEEWQTEVTMNTFGLCGKFVIDDEGGTIRLPKYPNYFIAGLANIAPVVGNGMTLGLTDGTHDYGLVASANHASSWRGLAPSSNYGQNVGVTATINANYQNNVSSGVTTDSTKSGIEAQINEKQITGQYFIQVATGSETEDNIINEIELNNPYSFGDSKYSPVALNNLSWLKSEGQYNSKAVYPAYYEWALINANNGVEGFKFVTDEYTDYDVVINSAEETFRLPLLDGSESLPSGKFIENIFTTVTTTRQDYTCPANGFVYIGRLISYIDTLYVLKNGIEINRSGSTANTNNDCCYINVCRGDIISVFDDTANASASISYFEYAQGNGSLYFYVGETVQNANLINAGRIEEKVAECITRMDCKAYIVETYKNGTSWYRIWSDGWCEQGGTGTNNASAVGTITTTLLKSYVDTNYTVLVTRGISATQSLNIVYKSNDSFQAQSTNTPSGLYYWQTSGYIA